ncbi:hypothetical protein CPC08DRAFT_445543 [Agrocybe pediades]|nr:hypothetical protein CPC08DRAFT_445543 [Agrocybe pediades]
MYKAWKDKVDNMKKSSSFAAFVYRRVLEFIAFPVFSLSVACAFLFIYATVDIYSPSTVCGEDAEEVFTMASSTVPSADTTSTAVDTRPSENASSVEITEIEDTAAAVGLLDEMKSSLEEAQHSSEAIEDEVFREAVVDEGLVVQEVAEEKVADEEAPSPEMVEEDLVDELSEAPESVDGTIPYVDEYEEVAAEVDVEAEAEVVDTAATDVPEVLEDESLCYVAESSAEVIDQTVLGEEEVEELEEEVESLDVEEDVEEVSGEIEEGIEEVEEAEVEVDGEVDYAEESGDIEETGFSEEVSGEAEEEEYEQVEEEVSGEVEEPSEESGEAEEEVEYAEEDEQEKSEEVEEVFEYDEEPRRVEPDLYVPRDDAEYPIDEPQQEEEDPNAVEGLGWNSIRVNLSAESLVSATIDHANMGLVTTIETECVLINIVASSTVASLEREAGELEEEVEAEKEEDNDEQDQSEVSLQRFLHL